MDYANTLPTVPVGWFPATLLIALNLVLLLVAGLGIFSFLFFFGFVGDMSPGKGRRLIWRAWLSIVGLVLASGVFTQVILSLWRTRDWPWLLQTLPFAGYALWHMFVWPVFRES